MTVGREGKGKGSVVGIVEVARNVGVVGGTAKENCIVKREFRSCQTVGHCRTQENHPRSWCIFVIARLEISVRSGGCVTEESMAPRRMPVPTGVKSRAILQQEGSVCWPCKEWWVGPTQQAGGWARGGSGSTGGGS